MSSKEDKPSYTPRPKLQRQFAVTEKWSHWTLRIISIHIYSKCLWDCKLCLYPINVFIFIQKKKNCFRVVFTSLIPPFLNNYFQFSKKPVWPVIKQDTCVILNDQILPDSKPVWPVWLVWPCSLIGSQSSLCSSSI